MADSMAYFSPKTRSASIESVWPARHMQTARRSYLSLVIFLRERKPVRPEPDLGELEKCRKNDQSRNAALRILKELHRGDMKQRIETCSQYSVFYGLLKNFKQTNRVNFI